MLGYSLLAQILSRWQLPRDEKPQNPDTATRLTRLHLISPYEHIFQSILILLMRVIMSSKCAGFVACLCSCIAIAVGQISPASAPQPAAPAPGPSSAYSQVETRPLDPFTRVALCVPFTVLVQPSTGYQVTIEAESAVREAVTALIDGNTLILEASAFTTQQQIKVTVGLPASNLSSVTARGTAPVIVSPGFSSSMLMINAQGTGSLGVLGVNYTSMQLVNSGWVLLLG